MSPTFEPDRSCLQKIAPLDFAGTTADSKQSALRLFGTDNVWGTGGISTTDSTTTSENKNNSALENKKNTILSFLCVFFILTKIF